MSEPIVATEVSELLQQANAVLKSGDSYDALQLFRAVTERDPSCAEAWVGLADSVRPYKDKREYLQHAQSLDPDNEEIQSKIQDVESKIAAGEILAPVRKPNLPNTPEQQPAPVIPQDDTTEDVAYCYRHSDRETGLHCIQCGNPICYECVRPAVVGQLCPDCALERRPPNYQVSRSTLVLAGSVSIVVSFLLSILVMIFLGGFFLAFFIALILGSVLSNLLVRLLDRLTRAKRGREMQITVGVGLACGAAPFLLLSLSLTLLIFTIAIVVGTVTQLR